MSINRDEWLKALTEAGVVPAVDEHAITTKEYAESFGVSQTTAKDQLHKLVKAGRATRVQKRVTDTAGRSQTVSAYRLVTP